MIWYNIIGDGMENKNFEDYENLCIIIDADRKEEVIFNETTEQSDLKSFPVVEDN